MTATQTTSSVRRGFEYIVAIGAGLFFGPILLAYTIDIAAAEEGWRPWVFVAVPMLGLAGWAYATMQLMEPPDVALQITLMVVIGVLLVLAERAGFTGL